MIPALRIAYFLDQFPELTETFISGEVAELVRLGHDVRVESSVRAPHPGDDVPATYGTDDSRAHRLRALASLVARHPVGCARDVLGQRRWRRQEAVRPLRRLAPVALRVRGVDHLHAHFAMGAALDAMRVGALLGIPYSVMTHGYDIFKTPSNLVEKHARAAFAATPCEYSARYLRDVCGVDAEVIVMGVDGSEFKRDRPHTEGRTVVAVARLTEKKGLIHLVRAAERMDARVLIVGDGPLRALLKSDRVELLGARSPAEIKAIVQDAAVLAMPCVIAADGDRDTMPLVVKEALALEIPVVASDAVGLPECVQDAWGRLVPPGDASALAAALSELLDLPASERQAMGRAGRAFVLEHCSRAVGTARLARLMGA